MKLENQVASLELSKKLKKLGVKQESVYVWYDEGERIALRRWTEIIPANIVTKNEPEICSAFTVAELGEMLPSGFNSGRADSIAPKELPAIWWCRTYNNEREEIADTEANARAKMLIYLIENNLLNKESEE